MQTLKTAVVVVLLLTITYSAYVAITAPPAELPPEVEKIVEGDFDFDIGVPDGDGDGLGTDYGFAANDASPAVDSSLDADSTGLEPSFDFNPAPPANATGLSGTDPAYVASLSDQGSSVPTATPPVPPQSTPYTPPQTNALVNSPPSIPAPATPSDPGIDNLASAGGSTTPAPQPSSEFDIPSIEGAGPMETTPPPTAAATSNLAQEAARTALVNAIATADRQREKDQLKEALTTLSLFYNAPNMSPEDRVALLPRLDFLAAEVIYSTRHLLELPYQVSQGETLQTIAAKFDVPWNLLGTINGITDPTTVVPGTELKVVRGPFRAEVNLASDELTLFLGELYAGRFPIAEGTSPAPKPGTYTVRDKQSDKPYYPGAGAAIPGGDPRNPYGDVWLDLGDQMSIHASSGSSDATGCIKLRAADARDVFGILSEGSDVTIIR